MPGSLLFQYALSKGRSVASRCVTRYCSGERREIASGFLLYSAIFLFTSGSNDIALGQRGGATPCPRYPAARECFTYALDRDLDRGSEPANLMQFRAIRYVAQGNKNPRTGARCGVWKLLKVLEKPVTLAGH